MAVRFEVSIPQAVFTRCNTIGSCFGLFDSNEFQYRKRYLRVATNAKQREEAVYHEFVSIPQAVFTCCNLLAVQYIMKTMAELFQYRKRYLRVATWLTFVVLYVASVCFNTASGIYALQPSKYQLMHQKATFVSIPQAVFTRCNLAVHLF